MYENNSRNRKFLQIERLLKGKKYSAFDGCKAICQTLLYALGITQNNTDLVPALMEHAI